MKSEPNAAIEPMHVGERPSLRSALDTVLPSGPGASHDIGAILRQIAGDHNFPGLADLIRLVE